MHRVREHRCDRRVGERTLRMKTIIRLLYRLRYGVRGAIKPPLNWNRMNSRWYRYRYRVWRIEARIYDWTGLPAQWWESVSGEKNATMPWVA